MKFTIIWTKQALDDLAELWISTANKSERDDITHAANKVDDFLTALMQEQANGKSSKTFILQINMLGICYEFSPLDCMIKIIGIWKS